jgi:predicted TIM-barrel fold metal-dependent hydrolase
MVAPTVGRPTPARHEQGDIVADSSGRPYVLISTDAHAGADRLGYKPYLPSSLHEQFDAWAADFHDPWEELDEGMYDTDDSEVVMGRASFVSRYSWESETRVRHMDAEGIAAEVVFPNTVPPFYPSGIITALAPRSEDEYRLRWEGIKAHNRWLADFCAALPGRRAGLAQVFLDDLDETVAEMRWAREHGLAGVLIPGDSGALYDPALDQLWAAACDLDLPVHRHAIIVTEQTTDFSSAAGAVGAHEIMFWFGRALGHLVLGGVFERFPDLKFVMTESGCAWAVPELAKLDGEIRFGKSARQGEIVFAAVGDLERSATEYFQRNCWIGMSTVRPDEIACREQLGVDRLMWGADYPHTEGSFPHTRLVLRLLFSDVPEDEVRTMTSRSAAEVYGFDLDRLQQLADEIGPTVEEVATPVTPDELPDETLSSAIMAAKAVAAASR